MNKLFYLTLFVLISWSVLILSMHIDRSRYRNTLYLSIALLSLILLLDVLLETTLIRRIFQLMTAYIVLSVPFLLIINGIVMIRREGIHFADLLSLLLGIIILAGEISAIYIFITPYYNQDGIATIPAVPGIISISVLYFSLVFVSFMLYCLLLEILPVKKDFDYIIILGCGLIHGNQHLFLLS